MSSAPRNRQGSRWLAVAAVLGIGHGLFSLYWAGDGTWLPATVGDMAEQFEGRLWLLLPVGLVKIAAGVDPWLLARRGWPWRPLTRAVCWLGGLVLILWGGLSTVASQLVLASILFADGGFDRAAMLGHAWLWDPWLVLWGVALILGLVASRRAGSNPSS